MGWLRPLDNLGDEIALRRSARARRMTLRVSQLDGRITLTLPIATSEREARGFLDNHRDWIDRARARVAPEVAVAPGVEVPVEGRLRPVVASSGRQARIFDDRIEMPSARTLAARLKLLARERAMPRIDAYAARLERSATGVTFRDTRSRWGSCTSDGKLMLSWRLILAPPEVYDYVIAHEVAHLVEMNHSKAFWSRVAELRPDYRTHQVWLKTHGPGLHRFRFD